MATAKAKAGARAGTKEPPKPPKKTAGKAKKRAPRGQSKASVAAAQFLAEVKAEVPGITSDIFAVQFRLPLEEVGRMKQFVLEYLKDFSPTNAALRMGYPPESAGDTGRRWHSNAFVQLRIDETLAKAEVGSIVSAGQVTASLWKEANREDTVAHGCVMSNSPSRISALKELAKILGMLIPKEAEPEKVVRYVMHIPAPFDWERGAIESQRALKASVIVDV